MKSADNFDLRKFITEGKLLKEETLPGDYLLLIWDEKEQSLTPDLLMVFTSDNYSDINRLSELGKGELADMIEEKLGIKIDPSDFGTEEISLSDFLEEYGSANNPNRVELDTSKIFEI